MERYEYKVIPAPEKGLKVKGLKTPEARFSNTLEQAMNELGADGWEYWRAECLPSIERSGLTSSKTVERHVLVFRRRLSEPGHEAAAEPVRRVVRDPAPEPEPDAAPEQPRHERMPVFTRRLELAREQRESVRHEEDDGDTPRIRPVGDD